MAQGGAGGAGRSTASVLFTDLVGSTELRSRLGESEADEVRRNHDRLIAGAVEANRGRLVKNLGDGVMATFTGASDALAAAVAIQQALDRHNRSGSTDAPLEVRIGVSAGDVAFEEADCFGTPVIEAARLCAAAGGGTILVTDVVRVLAGIGGGHQLTPVGALELKGLPAPVPVCEVMWEPLAGPLLAMPALLTRAGRIFVGRDEELERLLQLWKEVMAGERWVALLAGEPGIGKTRLAVEVAGAVRELGGVVLAGRCDEDLGVPYQPFVEALRHYVTGAEDRRLGRYAGELARLLPELAQFVGGLPEPLRSDPETERYRLFDALAAWLSDVSVEVPVLLVIDDLHWAAKPTLLLLRHVLRSPEPLRLLVVATYRDSDIGIGRDHPMSHLLAELRRDGGMERLAISGLDTAGVAAFIEAAAGHSLDDEESQELPRAVWRETEGNPFFVAEVMRHLSESRAIEQREGRWVLRAAVGDLGIPEGVRDVVGRRLSRLAESTNRVLATAAVVGLEFDPVVVGRAGGVGEDEFIAALEEATRARLLVEVPGARYRFAHALVRATLYEELTGARRVALHRRVAEAIESLYGRALDDHLPALAHHWARASVPAADTARAVDYAARAGDRALDQLAHDDAVGYYHQALDLLAVAEGPAEESRRLELLISLGEAQRRAGQPEYRETLLEAARLAQAGGDSQQLSRAALAISGGSFSTVGGFDHEMLAVLEAALESVGKEDSGVRAQLLANLGVELTWNPDRDRRLALNDEALAIAERLGQAAILGSVLAARCISLWDPISVPERLTNTARLLTLSEQLTDPVARFWALWRRTIVLNDVGAVEEADRTLEACEEQACELRQPSLRWFATYYRATQLLMKGKIQEGEHVASDAWELARDIDERKYSLFIAVQQFYVRFEQGRLADTEGAMREATSRAPTVPLYQALLGLLYCELDRHEDARRVLTQLAEIGFTSFPLNNTWMAAVAASSLVAAQLCDAESAAMLYDVLAPFGDYMACHSLIWLGCVEYHLGILATTLRRWEDAETHFAAAARSHGRIGAPTWLARTRLEWARMLLARQERNDIERASAFSQDALETARDLGLGSLERRTAKLLQDLR